MKVKRCVICNLLGMKGCVWFVALLGKCVLFLVIFRWVVYG